MFPDKRVCGKPDDETSGRGNWESEIDCWGPESDIRVQKAMLRTKSAGGRNKTGLRQGGARFCNGYARVYFLAKILFASSRNFLAPSSTVSFLYMICSAVSLSSLSTSVAPGGLGGSISLLFCSAQDT